MNLQPSKPLPLRGDTALTHPNLYGYGEENRFSGVLSFMRRRYTRDLRGADVAISGVPLDLATSFRPGARLGPAAIRAASVQLNEKLYPWGFGPCDHLAVADCGDCWLDVHNPMSLFEAISDHASAILNQGCRLLTLGGDHSISYPLLHAHAQHWKQPLALIHFDAHSDTWIDDQAQSLNHGTMFYKAIQDGLIDAEHSVQVGIRTWNDDFRGVQVLGADWVHAHGVNATVQQIRQRVGTRPVYLSFDVDCLDPAHAPGTGTPVPAGLSSAQALGILRQLGGLNWTGMDVVEVAPPYDHADITALIAAQIAAEMLCLFTLQLAPPSSLPSSPTLNPLP